MKQFFRFAIVTLMLLISTSSFAQLEGMFYSQEYMDDVEAFKGTIKGSIKTRCEKLKQLGHMNDEGEIQYQYVIKLKDSLDMSRFMETVRAWAEVNYKDAKKNWSKKQMIWSNTLQYMLELVNLMVHSNCLL